MEKVYPDSYYMRAMEDITGSDGVKGYYSRFIFVNEINCWVADSYKINSKQDLLEKVEEILIRHLSDLSEYKRVETKYGWTYERYVRWFNEDMDYEVKDKDGDWTHHEVFTVDISLYEQVHEPMLKLK
ncbi:hypothetical protein P9X10_02435 [Bacillus cereus]|nr:hypothetical protein [Bacillus cereus]